MSFGFLDYIKIFGLASNVKKFVLIVRPSNTEIDFEQNLCHYLFAIYSKLKTSTFNSMIPFYSLNNSY